MGLVIEPRVLTEWAPPSGRALAWFDLLAVLWWWLARVDSCGGDFHLITDDEWPVGRLRPTIEWCMTKSDTAHAMGLIVLRFSNTQIVNAVRHCYGERVWRAAWGPMPEFLVGIATAENPSPATAHPEGSP